MTEINRSETEESLDMILHSISLLQINKDDDDFVKESINKVEKHFDVLVREIKLLINQMDNQQTINTDEILLEAQIENFCKISEILTFHGKILKEKFLRTIITCINKLMILTTNSLKHF